MSNEEYEILIYAAPNGEEPFQEWISCLKDRKGQGIILRRIQRLRLGLFGDAKTLLDGVHELRIDFGPGYRVYFAKIGKRVLLLLAGGDKSSQNVDIKMARIYLLDYRKTHG